MADETPQNKRVAEDIRSISWGYGRVLWTTLLVVAVIAGSSLLISLLASLRYLIFFCVISIFLAYLLEPLVKLIRRPFEARQLEKLMPRPLAILLSFLLVFSIAGLMISYLLPSVVNQVKEFAANLPVYSTSMQERINAVNDSFQDAMVSSEVQDVINSYITSFVSSLTSILTTAAGIGAITVILYLPWFVLVPILTFFFLKDAAALRRMFLSCFPSGSWRARADSLVSDVNKTLAAYTRAQLISCLLIGLLCTLAFSLIGIEYALLLGLLAGILEFVPLLGPLTLAITAITVAGISGSSGQAVGTAVFLVILRVVHDYFTYPRIVRDGIHLHPFAVILSILAGEQIAGVAGVFLSIPVIALLTVFYKHILAHSGKTGVIAEYLSRRSNDDTIDEVDPA